jgi:hypothetical protein
MERAVFLLQGKASIHLFGGFNPAWLLSPVPHLIWLLFLAVAAREYTPKDVAVFVFLMVGLARNQENKDIEKTKMHPSIPGSQHLSRVYLRYPNPRIIPFRSSRDPSIERLRFIQRLLPLLLSAI